MCDVCVWEGCVVTACSVRDRQVRRAAIMWTPRTKLTRRGLSHSYAPSPTHAPNPGGEREGCQVWEVSANMRKTRSLAHARAGTGEHTYPPWERSVPCSAPLPVKRRRSAVLSMVRCGEACRMRRVLIYTRLYTLVHSRKIVYWHGHGCSLTFQSHPATLQRHYALRSPCLGRPPRARQS